MSEGEVAADITRTAPPDDGRAAVPAAPLDAAERYQVLGEHARGGLGRVLRVYDRAMGRVVAIKELLRRDRAAEVRFFREAFVTGRLEHPSIVPVHEAGQWPDGTPYYSMKLVAGRPLRELIQAATSLEQRLALVPHVIAVADAVAYAHARDVIHRDLKPSNVVVGDFGETVVIDWGLAKELGSDDGAAGASSAAGAELTELGTVVGTPAYLAPEQARGEPADTLSDVYALGALLYCVVSGRSPYHERAAADIVRAVRAGPPPPLAALCPHAPPDLVAIAEAAMARDRARRLPSARAIADELRRFQAGQLVRSRRYTLAERALRWMRRHRELSAAIGAAGLVIAAIGAVAVRRVVAERDAADAQRHRAEAALADAAARRDQLVLTHSRAAIATDPVEAVRWLLTYRGPDRAKHQELAALAIGDHPVIFARAFTAARGISARAVGFDPPRVIAATSDRALSLWAAGAPGPRLLAAGVDDRVGYAVSVSAGAVAFAQDGRVMRAGDGATRTVLAPAAPIDQLAFSVDGGALLIATRAALYVQRGDDAPIDLGLAGAAPRASAIAAGGRAVATCDAGGLLWGWRPATGWRGLARCDGDDDVRYAPAGDRLVVLGRRRARLLDAATGQVLAVVTPPAPIASHAFASDGSLLIGDQRGGLLVVDAAGARHLAIAGSTAISALTGNRDHVAAGCTDGTVHLLRRATGHHQVVGRGRAVASVELSADGGRLLVGDLDGVRVLAVDRDPVWPHDGRMSYNAAYSADGRWLAMDTQAGPLLVVDRSRPPAEALTVLAGHTDIVYGVRFAGERLVSSSWDGTARVWQPGDAGWTSRAMAHRGRVLPAVVDGGGRAYTLDDTGQITAIEPATGASRPLHRSTEPPLRLAVTPDGAHLAMLSTSGRLELLELASGARRAVTAHAAAGGRLAVSPRGTFFASTGKDGVLDVRAPDGGRLFADAVGGDCTAVAVSARDQVAAGCDRDGLVLWSPWRWGGRAVRRSLDDAVYSLAFSPDGRHLAVGTEGGRLYVLDLGSGALAARRLAGTVSAVAFSPAGDELAVTSLDPNVRVVRLASLAFVPADDVAGWLAARADSGPPP
jgi:WD40 repeat protein